jgi:hypothetical protein
MTKTDKFNGVSFQFEELVKVLDTKNPSQLVLHLVGNVSKYLWHPRLESSLDLQSHLVHELKSLTARIIDEKGENDELVLMSRRIQFATFRAMNHYADAEALQRLEPERSLRPGVLADQQAGGNEPVSVVPDQTK